MDPIYIGTKVSVEIRFFRVYADFEADNGIDFSNTGNETSNTYKQDTACNGYSSVSDSNDF